MAERLEKLATIFAGGGSALQKWVAHDNYDVRQDIFEFLKDDIFKPNYSQSLEEFREQTLARFLKYSQHGFFRAEDYLENPRLFMASMECLAFIDYSLFIKTGAHYLLCTGTICKLGTKSQWLAGSSQREIFTVVKFHHDKYWPLMNKLTSPGCFGMTELGHGSNVMGIETTATYDPTTQEFVINTPSDSASKYWIGGAGQHGQICTVLAQLYIHGQCEGPHFFVVRIRDEAGRPIPGIRIQDNGPKMGLNGVDNGQIWFDSIRVPREDMLNRYANVAPDGKYTSSIASVSQRFGATVSTLTMGRILIGQAAVDSLKIGLCIAIRYSLQRRQFQSVRIMEYVTHQSRLLPVLAQAYAMHICKGNVKRLAYGEVDCLSLPESPAAARRVFLLSAALKAAATWYKTAGLQLCRECCGGQGVLSENRIGPIALDTNVDTTFEGDNTIMMQQVAKMLVAEKPNVHTVAPTVPVGRPLQDATISQLLQLRVNVLTKKLYGLVQQAVDSSMGPEETAAAPAAALQANGDLAVSLGWAYIHSYAFESFLQAIPGAPMGSQGPLCSLATLYGLRCIMGNASFYYSHGMLPAGSDDMCRHQQLQLQTVIMGERGKTVLSLCDGFGIPDHCIQAPIAFGRN